MGKKGKFKLLSYFLDEYLIFYNSQNKNKKIVAFAIFKISYFDSIVSALNEILLNGLLSYYSIQINLTEKNEIIVVLNFQGEDKSSILKLFNMVSQTLLNEKIQIDLLKEKVLESEFFNIGIERVDRETRITKVSNSLVIQYQNDCNILDLYKLNLNKIQNLPAFINNLLNILLNFNKLGHLIFNIGLDSNGTLTLSSYFVEIRNTHDNRGKLEDEVNSFFNSILMSKLNANVRMISQLLWRLNLFKKSFPLEKFMDLFTNAYESPSRNLSEFNSQIENNLSKENIQFNRINKNLIFINDKIVFLLMHKIKANLIKSVLEKFYSKYQLYILIIDWNEYKKLIENKELMNLKRVRILNPDEFSKLSLETFM